MRRADVVAEARTWVGTPYHHAAMVRGAGVDCAMILVAVYRAVGYTTPVEIEAYPHDWHLHSDDERYLAYVTAHADRVDAPHPGDIALFRFGRSLSHGGIVTAWPHMVHADAARGLVLEEDVSTRPDLLERLGGFWSPRGLEPAP